MTTITKGNIAEYTLTGEFDIAASVRPDEDAAKSSAKTVTLRFKLNAVPLADVIHSSLKDKRINWQVGARKKYSELKAKSIVMLDYTGGKAPVDPMQYVIDQAAAAGITEEEWRKAELAKRTAPKLEALK